MTARDDFREYVTKHITAIRDDIANVGIWQYLDDDNDYQVEFTVDFNLNLIGGRIQIEGGGPSTYLNTNGLIELYWGDTNLSIPMTWDNKAELREYIEEQYDVAREYA